MFAGFVEQFEDAFGEVLLLEVAVPVFVGVDLDHSLLEEGVDLLGFQHVRQRHLLPLWPDLVKSCQ